jgi:hypothetical protein
MRLRINKAWSSQTPPAKFFILDPISKIPIRFHKVWFLSLITHLNFWISFIVSELNWDDFFSYYNWVVNMLDVNVITSNLEHNLMENGPYTSA